MKEKELRLAIVFFGGVSPAVYQQGHTSTTASRGIHWAEAAARHGLSYISLQAETVGDDTNLFHTPVAG